VLRRPLLGLATFLFPALGLCAHSQTDDVRSGIDRYLGSRVVGGNLKVEVLVARNERVLLRREYGEARGSETPVLHGVHSRFPAGLVGEQFAAAAVLQLEEQRKIKLNGSICSYLSNCPGTWGEIKVIDLLIHASGLPPEANLAPKSSLDSPKQQTLDFKPGSMVKYSPLDFLLVDSVIEKVSGRLGQRYIERQIFYPLRMNDTRYPSGQTPRYDAVTTTVEDLCKWNQALAEGKIISPQSFVEMLTPYRDGYALGWKIIREFGRRLAVQTGVSKDASVSIRFYPDDETLIILVAGGVHADSATLSHDVAGIVFGAKYPLSSGF
jgi:CubicO group peptidase (beta-lactamase class C family)